ncbi:MFS transporter, partial [Xanthomonas citri pv. citri]|nr:MFS transporter [Xanthomonas citri pv. citri]
AVLTVSLTGLTNAAGRLFMAVLSDRLGRIAALNILCGVNLLCALCLIFAGGPFYLVIVLVTAFAYGGPASVNPALCTDLFGTKHAGANYGV